MSDLIIVGSFILEGSRFDAYSFAGYIDAAQTQSFLSIFFATIFEAAVVTLQSIADNVSTLAVPNN